MRHIQPISLNEAKKAKPIPSTATLIGFIMYINSRWYYGAFYTFHDFAAKLYEDFSGYDVDDQFFGDVAALHDALQKSMSDIGEDSDMVISMIDSSNFWWGLTTKCAPNILLDFYCSGDPYEGARALDLAFTDTKSLMKKWSNGMESEPGYIGLSIANDHSHLEKYLERVEAGEAYFDVDDILGSINAKSKELQALVKYHKIKGLI